MFLNYILIDKEAYNIVLNNHANNCHVFRKWFKATIQHMPQVQTLTGSVLTYYSTPTDSFIILI